MVAGGWGIVVGQRGQGGPQRVLVGAGAPLHRGCGGIRGHPRGDEPVADGSTAGRPHEHHHRAAQGGHRLPIDRALSFGWVLMAGDHGERRGGVAHGDRNPGVSRDGHRRGDAGHHLEVHVGTGQRGGLFPTAGEHEGVASFEPNHLLSGPAPGHEQGVDVVLGGAGSAGLFAHRNALSVRRGQIEQRGHRQPVVHHHVGTGQHLRAPQGQQGGIARPRAHQVHGHRAAPTGRPANRRPVTGPPRQAVGGPDPAPEPPRRRPPQPRCGTGRQGRQPAPPASTACRRGRGHGHRQAAGNRRPGW